MLNVEMKKIIEKILKCCVAMLEMKASRQVRKNCAANNIV